MNKRKRTSEKEYHVSDFTYLIGTKHIDPENSLEYETVRIRKYGQLIVADRRLAASPTSPTEAIHALDIAAITYSKTSKHIDSVKPAETDNSPAQTLSDKNYHIIKSKPHRTREQTASPHRTLNKPKRHRTYEQTTSTNQTTSENLKRHRTILESINRNQTNQFSPSHRQTKKPSHKNKIDKSAEIRKSERIRSIKSNIINNLVQAEINRRANEVQIPKHSTQARKMPEAEK